MGKYEPHDYLGFIGEQREREQGKVWVRDSLKLTLILVIIFGTIFLIFADQTGFSIGDYLMRWGIIE